MNGRDREANARRSSSVRLLRHSFFASFGARRFTRIVSPSARRSAIRVFPTLRERECTTHGVDVFVDIMTWFDESVSVKRALSLAREASKEQLNVVAGASELVVMTREIFFPNDSVTHRTVELDHRRRPADQQR